MTAYPTHCGAVPSCMRQRGAAARPRICRPSLMSRVSGGTIVKIQRLLIVLTAVNFVLLVFLAFQARQAVAQDVVPVLRGHALEIVDDRGRARASITIYTA